MNQYLANGSFYELKGTNTDLEKI